MYKNMNDYEILYMVGENNRDMFDLLYQKYSPLIYKISTSYLSYFKKFGYELEDMMQVGYLTLYKCSCLYNVYSDSMFFSYFKSSMKRALINEIRLNKTLKRETLNNSFSYENTIPNTNLTYQEILADNNHNDYELYNKIFFEIKNSMSFDLACVFEMFVNGYNLEEISILLNKDQNKIDKMYREIKSIMLTYKCLFLNKDVIE